MIEEEEYPFSNRQVKVKTNDDWDWNWDRVFPGNTKLIDEDEETSSIIEIGDNDTDDKSRESYWIKYYTELGFILCNKRGGFTGYDKKEYNRRKFLTDIISKDLSKDRFDRLYNKFYDTYEDDEDMALFMILINLAYDYDQDNFIKLIENIF